MTAIRKHGAKEGDSRARHPPRHGGWPATRGMLAVLPPAWLGRPARLLRRLTGIRLGCVRDYACGPVGLRAGEGVLFPALGVMLLDADPDRLAALRPVSLAIQPNRRVRGLGALPGEFMDTEEAAWGLRATGVPDSALTGRGARVAILDSGIDSGHADFRNRPLVTRAFDGTADARDEHGHGTFCAGIACGPRVPDAGPRYGIAADASLYIAKVLGASADGTDASVLAAIDWAVQMQCDVVSLSVGCVVGDDEPCAAVYEQAAARALEAGTLLVAPAGNRSQRPDLIAPVESPANCSDIVAVGAVGPDLGIAAFSNGQVRGSAGEVDLVAPGVAIHSASLSSDPYAVFSGTSMAAPFVAGIAALLVEADPTARGARLRDRLRQRARPVAAARADAGAGLVQVEG